ncbi:hypothetical protein TNCT_25091 [Trichonephila clavata]|uniref:Uncharacterized protein n=1 Tax=Trichonephila clavata TaxID=2740835 RepID=A0A8X6M748_TRICU|nr:hypothetical protein TNCT_25091 [Trichonephila clavata]
MIFYTSGLKLYGKILCCTVVGKSHKGFTLVRDSFVQKSETSGYLINNPFVRLFICYFVCHSILSPPTAKSDSGPKAWCPPNDLCLFRCFSPYVSLFLEYVWDGKGSDVNPLS